MYTYVSILCAEATPLASTSGQKRAAPRPGGLCAAKKSKKDGSEDTKEGAAVIHTCSIPFNHCTVNA